MVLDASIHLISRGEENRPKKLSPQDCNYGAYTFE